MATKYISKKSITEFNNTMIEKCSTHGLTVTVDNENTIECSAIKSGISIRVMLSKFDSHNKTTLHTLHCQMYPLERKDTKAVQVCNDSMLFLKGESNNYKYNLYTNDPLDGLEHLKRLLSCFDKV